MPRIKYALYLLVDTFPGIIVDRGPQSICVQSNNSDPDASIVANCVVRRCVQIQGTELTAFSLTFNSEDINTCMHGCMVAMTYYAICAIGQTEWCYPNGAVNNGQLLCPPIRYACARDDIDMISPNDPIPPPCE